MEPRPKLRIGDLLQSRGLIDDAQLTQALTEQKQSGKKLGRTLIDLGFIEEDALLGLLSEQLKIPFLDLRTYSFKPELVTRLPEAVARRFRALLLNDDGGRILVGMSDPLDVHAIDELQRRLNTLIGTAVVRERDLLAAIDRLYSRASQIASIASELEGELTGADFSVDELTATAGAEDAPVARLLRTIFEDAVRQRASDIHIEPDEAVIRIRKRIDGLLHEQVMSEKRIAAALVLKLKILSNLDISEKRLPQDGRFAIKVLNKNIDVRLSTLPVPFGESVVLRLLDQSAGRLDLDALAMPPKVLERFRHAINRPHGLILVTGPTGSGKTTTLYSALVEINRPDNKIITVEDPIEYRLPRITQVQVNAKIDLTFERVLRTALRQDPDIIMIGEMRDAETAEIGLRAAITGHLVFSTLHTNDAISSSIRFLDMGIEPYLAASALRGVMAQRLARRLCPHCKRPEKPEAALLALLENLTDMSLMGRGFFGPGGCGDCNYTGYRGRLGIYEWLEFDDAMGAAMRRNDQNGFIAAAQLSEHYQPLVKSALELALTGETSVEEVLRLVETD